MMTTVLRDSLGGNCMTAMLATLSIERNNIEVRKIYLVFFKSSLLTKFHLMKIYGLGDLVNLPIRPASGYGEE